MNPCIVLFGLLSVGAVEQSGDPAVLKRLREEYPPAARRLIEKSQNVELRIRRRRHMLNGRELPSVERLLRLGYSMLRDASINPDSKQATWRVLCRTRQRSFNLTKADAAGPFILESQNGGESTDPSEAFMLASYVEPYVDCMTSIMGNPFVDLMATSTFAIKNAREAVENDHKVVVVEFSGPLTAGNHQADVEGTVKLAPEIGWPITELSVKARPRPPEGAVPGSDSVSMLARREMTSETVGDEIHLKTYHERLGNSVNTSYQEDHVDVLESKYGAVTDDQFTLQAFGLPDVPLRPAPTRGFFSWNSPALWITLFLSLAVFVLTVAARRRAVARAA